jgi:hypothetical protein
VTRDVRARIEAFRELEADWDTYGSPPIEEAAIGAALRLHDAASTPPRYAAPIAGGGVGLIWGERPFKLEPDVTPDGERWGYLQVDRRDGRAAEEADGLTFDAMLARVERFLTERATT